MRRSRLWLLVGLLYFVVNAGGAVFAATQGEPLHAAIHVALLLLGVYVANRIMGRGKSEAVVPTDELTDLMSHLELSVEAVAIDVERIGEAQRFMTRVLNESATAPVEIKARESAPEVRD